jgi:hypothetical protein
MGCPGELHIGGEGLARGYLKRPGLSAEKFIPNPFDRAGRSPRLYKTGDLARFHADGRIECLGRADHQVKLRGHRIDPGEIESVLRQYPGVREALVLMREDEPDQKRLAAYLIGAKELSPDNEELQQFLKGKLPDYMIPGAIVVLQKFPITPNGKINRNALPVPDSVRAITSAACAPNAHRVPSGTASAVPTDQRTKSLRFMATPQKILLRLFYRSYRSRRRRAGSGDDPRRVGVTAQDGTGRGRGALDRTAKGEGIAAPPSLSRSTCGLQVARC